MLSAIAYVLGFILRPCYALTGNWWLAILVFTLITKVILMPISLWCQANSIQMLKLMPELNRLKVKHYGDKETIGEKQTAMYKEQHYHPLLSLIPLIIQLIILFGLVDLVHSITDSGAPGTELIGLIPVVDGGITWIMPVLAGLSAVCLCIAQNHINPLQREQSKAEQNMTNGLSIGLALVLGVLVAAGMAFYWICSNLSAILVQLLCNVIINPKKHVDYKALAASRVELDELESLEAGRKKKWWQRDPLAKREKADYKRFFDITGKHVVFYSEGSGFFKYFEGAIRYLLANSDGLIHYVTNDPHDQVFELAKQWPRLVPYYIGQKRAITLMMKMDADVVVMTQHDLDNYYIKRSYVRKDTEYVYLFHHMTSTHMVSAKTAFFNYDTVLCTGPHQMAELRRAEELYGLKKKKLLEGGYDLIDREVEAYRDLEASGKGRNPKPVVLIAPSWQADNILDTCIDDMLKGLVGRGWRVIVRPHPEYTKRFAARWSALQERWAHVPGSELYFERDFSSNETVWTSDIVVTDWSSIAGEFAFSTLKPAIFIDTPMKVHNPDWEELGIEPVDISWRNQIGQSVAMERAGSVGEVAKRMLADPKGWARRIEKVRDGAIYNLGHAAEVSGEYILSSVLAAQEARGERGEGIEPGMDATGRTHWRAGTKGNTARFERISVERARAAAAASKRPVSSHSASGPRHSRSADAPAPDKRQSGSHSAGSHSGARHGGRHSS